VWEVLVRKFFIFIFIISTLWAVLTCSLTNLTGQQDFKFTSNYIPMSLNSSWTYAVYDNRTKSADTVKVTIIDTFSIRCRGTQCEGKVTLWEFRYNNRIDTSSVTYVNDTFNSNSAYSRSGFVLVFPLEVGKYWLNSAVIDSSEVLGIDTLIVPAGKFANSYHIQYHMAMLDNDILNDYWIVPDVGFVSLHLYQFGISNFINETWQLLYYHITS